MNILVIGSINMDLVIETDIIPASGETLTGKGFSMVCGGKGANQAVAAAKMGANVKMIGAVGDDVFGERLIKNLEDCGVGTEGIEVFSGSSGLAVITVCRGDNRIILEPGANAKVGVDTINKNTWLIDWADVIIFQFEIPLDTVLYAAKKGKEMGKKIVINPAPYMDFPQELYELSDLIVPNEHEAAQLIGFEVNVDNANDAVLEICKKGAKGVVITLGENGCAYSENEEVKRFGVYKTKAVDTTAAGDSFIASLCVSLGEGKSMDDAVSFSSKVSAIVVSRNGAGTSIPTRQEVENVYLELAN